MIKKLINTQQITYIEINTGNGNLLDKNIITTIKFFNKKHQQQYSIDITGDQTKHVEVIEILILNKINDKQFIALETLKQAIIDRIKQAQKAIDNYENKD